MAAEIKATKYMEISSKEGSGITELFNEAVSLVFDQHRDIGHSASSDNSSGKKPSGKKKSGCVLL
jgi:hypothetical protein